MLVTSVLNIAKLKKMQDALNIFKAFQNIQVSIPATYF